MSDFWKFLIALIIGGVIAVLFSVWLVSVLR